MIKLKKQTSNKTKNFTIRDLRIGTIIRIHLCNDARGDKGYVTTEIVALFNSMGQKIYDCNADFTVVYDGQMWTGKCEHIDKIISY